MSKKGYSSWKIEADTKSSKIYIYEDYKFRVWFYHIDPAHDWLKEWVGPKDDLLYVNFQEQPVKVKGKKVLEL